MNSWYSVSCDCCGEQIIVPSDTARRVADSITFVLCNECAIPHIIVTGQAPFDPNGPDALSA